MGNLQQALNRIINKENTLSVASVWQSLRDTCAWADDELVGHAALLGAEFVKYQGLWNVCGDHARHFNVGITAWRWLMDNHRFVLEEEYNARATLQRVRSDSEQRHEG